MGYRVEQVDRHRARADLLRVWRDNLPIEGSPEHKYAWSYEGAPEPPLDPLLLVGGGDTRVVVGTAVIARRAFVVGGAPITAGLLADLAVDRPHRSALPALALVRTARDVASREVSLVYGFPNPKAEVVFRRAGYARLGGMVRYARVLRHADYAAGHLPPAVAGVAGAALDACAALRHAPARAAASRYRLSLTARADARVERIWAQAAAHYAVVARRSAAFLNWRFRPDAQGPHEFAWLEDRRGGRPRAYAVLRARGEDVDIRDAFGAPDDLRLLFARLAALARGRGARSLSFRFVGDRRVRAALRGAGFAPRRDRRAVVLDVRPELEGARVDPEAWFLTDADEDT